MASQIPDDDEQMMHHLAQALASVGPLGVRVRQLGYGAYAWHGVDAELEAAGLVYDSLVDTDVGVRGAADVRRTVLFQASTVSVEMERAGDLVLGQIVPPHPGVVSLVAASGDVIDAEVDDLGWFTFDRPTSGPVRLRWATADQAVITDWVSL